MRLIRYLAITFAVVSCTPTYAHAATKAAQGAFDVEHRGRYVGDTHNLGVLVEALKKQSLKKNEFETTDEYQARLAAIRLPGNLPLNATIAIKFPTDQIAPFCDNKYNADTREIIMSCEFGSQKLFIDAMHSGGIQAWTVGMASSKDVGTYKGANAFGVSKTIVKRVAYGRGLAFDNFQNATTGERSNYLRRLELTVPEVPTERARWLVGNMGVVFIADLTSPFLVSESRKDAPTLSNPMDFSGQYDFLYVHLRQMWLVDLKSGEVLQRFDNARNVLPD